MVWCPHCGEDHPQQRDDTSSCTVSCRGCGRVISHDVYTEEPTFKSSGGESLLERNIVRSIELKYSESFRRTLDKGKNRIHELAGFLTVGEDDNIQIQAAASYRIAVERGFTRGRETDLVAAACLYIACRKVERPVLLFDLSLCLRINVYALGAVFLQLCQLLSLQDHPIVHKPVDPSLFIHRYTEAVLGEHNVMVSNTALAIVASMKRDWMQTGRKPSGLCGAAVYISALSHGFSCSKSDVLKVVHVCEATLTKRLIEFENTESGSLTIEGLQKIDNELRKKDGISKQLDAYAQKNNSSMEVLCKHKDQKPHFAGMCKDCCEDFITLYAGLHGGADPPASPAFQLAEREREKEKERLLGTSSCEKTEDPSFVPAKRCQKKTSGHEDINEQFLDANQNVAEAETADYTEPARASAFVGDQATRNAVAAANVLQKHSNDFGGIVNAQERFFGTASSEDPSFFRTKPCQKKSGAYVFRRCSNDFNGVSDDPESLSDIDDDEVDGYLNNEEERRYKKIIWEEMNREYLQEQAAKKATGASDDIRTAKKLAAEDRRQRRASEAKNAGAAKTAAEATRQMLTKKSSKINYDALEKLFHGDPEPDSKRTRVESPHGSSVDEQQLSKETENEAYTMNDHDEVEEEQEIGDMEEMVAEEADADEWYTRDEEEEFDQGYCDNNGDDDDEYW